MCREGNGGRNAHLYTAHFYALKVFSPRCAQHTRLERSVRRDVVRELTTLLSLPEEGGSWRRTRYCLIVVFILCHWERAGSVQMSTAMRRTIGANGHRAVSRSGCQRTRRQGRLRRLKVRSAYRSRCSAVIIDDHRGSQDQADTPIISDVPYTRKKSITLKQLYEFHSPLRYSRPCPRRTSIASV